MLYKSTILLALVASASAFVPTKPAFTGMSKTALADAYSGKFEGQLWDIEAKLDVYKSWDPNSPRSALNFNPFETYEGNSPDTNGFFPGEGRYKDPMRPDVSYAKMMEERAILDDIAANPKAGPGCPGCRL